MIKLIKKGGVNPLTSQNKIGQTVIISALQPRVPHTQMIKNDFLIYDNSIISQNSITFQNKCVSKQKKSENQKEKYNFENSSFQFESYLFSEVKFARTHTAGFFANFHLKPEIRTNNGDN